MHAPAFYFKPHPSALALVLSPLATLYGWAAQRHGKVRAAHAYYAGVPVIGVGNLVLGGTGKTPLVAMLAKHYVAQGLQVAVVLRGYGGTESTQPLQVTFQHTAKQVGDEAAMLFAALPRHTQIWVGRHRPSVVRRAEQAGAQMIILDDAFQRRDVARNANILVMHGAAPFGNGLCLPAGPLREPMAGRSRADFAIIFNPAPLAPHEAPPYFGLTAYRLYLTVNPTDVEPLRGQRVLAFAGIGQPDKFFNSLSIAGVHVVHRVALPDHVRYTPALQRHLKALAHQHQAVLATTAKDAIKLPPGFAHTIKVAIEGEDLENVLAALERLLGR